MMFDLRSYIYYKKYFDWVCDNNTEFAKGHLSFIKYNNEVKYLIAEFFLKTHKK